MHNAHLVHGLAPEEERLLHLGGVLIRVLVDHVGQLAELHARLQARDERRRLKLQQLHTQAHTQSMSTSTHIGTITQYEKQHIKSERTCSGVAFWPS